MKRSILTALFAASLFPFILGAEDGSLRIQADFTPSISLDEDYSTGLGGRIGICRMLTPTLGLGGAFGHANYNPTSDWEDRYGSPYRYQRMLVTTGMASAAFYLSAGGLRAFASGGIGASIVNEKYEYYYSLSGWVPVDASYVYFTLEPAIGAEIDIGAKLFMSASLRALVILGWSNLVSADIGVGFKL